MPYSQTLYQSTLVLKKKMAQSSLVFAGIAPHPPIMVPEVGGEAAQQVRASIEAMRELTGRIIDCEAETVVIISPHAPLEASAFVAYDDESLRGDFAHFQAADAAQVEAGLDAELLTAITHAASEEELAVTGISDFQLDHGTAVPLYFLQRNGWRGRVVALGYSFLSNEDHLCFGRAIKRAVEETHRPVAFVASGDLSHRLKPGAPAGYNRDAHLFDETVVAAIKENAPERIAALDQDLRKRAGECGYRSMLVALGLMRDTTSGACEVLSYEAPFGVGYLVAQLYHRPAADKQTKESKDSAERNRVAGQETVSPPPVETEDWPALARRAVETYTIEGRVIEPPSTVFHQPSACFVSIKTLDGDLRGCIGTIEPAHAALAEEVIKNGISAATRDPRFPPVEAAELSGLRYSVDVLFPPETAQIDDLDPKTFGVIVEDEDGSRRGLLLPDIEGVETAAQQIEIAQRKAGIAPGTPIKLSRFRVERFREKRQNPLR